MTFLNLLSLGALSRHSREARVPRVPHPVAGSGARLRAIGLLRCLLLGFCLAAGLSGRPAAQCLGCGAFGASLGGSATCIVVTASLTINRQGECDENEAGACFANTATDTTCRFTYTMDVDVTGCCWDWKHEICSIANNGQRLGCATNPATICGDSYGGGTIDLTCGTEWRAGATIGGFEIGYVKMQCMGCLPPPV